MNRTAAIILAMALAIAACGSDDDRPTAAEWRPVWDAARALVPSEAEIAEAGEEVCGSFLGEVRASREDLLPTPREVLDGSVRDWIAEAESIGLDCPDPGDDLSERLGDLAVLAAEVDGGLDASG